MTHTKLTIIVSAIALGLISSTAFAGRGHKRGHHWKKGHITEALNLTETQQQQLDSIRAESRNNREALREKIRKLNDQMRAEWGKGSPQKSNLVALNRQIHHLKQKLGEHRIDSRLKTMAVLTPEQRARMTSRMKEGHKGRFNGKHGHKMGKKEGKGQNKFKKGRRGKEAHTKNRRHRPSRNMQQCVDTRLVKTSKKRPV